MPGARFGQRLSRRAPAGILQGRARRIGREGPGAENEDGKCGAGGVGRGHERTQADRTRTGNSRTVR